MRTVRVFCNLVVLEKSLFPRNKIGDISIIPYTVIYSNEEVVLVYHINF